ncbi:MAG TPA: transcriptional regulator [Candidatus Thermoplasmatota archaeon]|nr:transcriptional regulator [Candidatus Thermoplasmatota archaeon]
MRQASIAIGLLLAAPRAVSRSCRLPPARLPGPRRKGSRGLPRRLADLSVAGAVLAAALAAPTASAADCSQAPLACCLVDAILHVGWVDAPCRNSHHLVAAHLLEGSRTKASVQPLAGVLVEIALDPSHLAADSDEPFLRLRYEAGFQSMHAGAPDLVELIRLVTSTRAHGQTSASVELFVPCARSVARAWAGAGGGLAGEGAAAEHNFDGDARAVCGAILASLPSPSRPDVPGPPAVAPPDAGEAAVAHRDPAPVPGVGDPVAKAALDVAGAAGDARASARLDCEAPLVTQDACHASFSTPDVLAVPAEPGPPPQEPPSPSEASGGHAPSSSRADKESTPSIPSAADPRGVLPGYGPADSGSSRGSLAAARPAPPAPSPAEAWSALLTLAALAGGLYHRISRERALEQETRRSVYELIRREPGLRTGTVAARLGLSYKTVGAHLRYLAQFGYVEGIGDGQRRYFATGSISSADKRLHLAASRPASRLVLEFVRERKTVALADLRAALAMPKATATSAVRALQAAGLVTVRREGRFVFVSEFPSRQAEKPQP